MRVDERFQELYRAEFGAVYRAVFLACGDRSVAEDATQEAFARALERWGRLRDRPWVAGWVATTAMNVARRSLRRRPGPELEGAVGAAGADPDAAEDVRRAVRRLPPRQREAVVLHYAMDLPVVEVARLMRCAEGTVKAHLSKAREALRGRLEGVRDEG
ncbi:MAG: sigma-70 family RNA polymerase sigma factor [Actinomycetota bacterium]|nr:sigma-70 family RNA polymerase sigma factor [Actinomycetota bacterium]